MTPAHHDPYGRPAPQIHSALAAALRADQAAIAAAVTKTIGGDLDPHSREFVRSARRLVLACATALVSVLEFHRPAPHPSGRAVCRACHTAHCPTLRRIAEVLTTHDVHPAPIDRTEAWRRADAHLSQGRRHVAIEIQEFPHGFVAWPAYGPADSLLVIDGHTGHLTRWPRLPLETLTREYHAYLTAHPTPGR
ncbi:hypothetical protein SAMN04489712_101491 [Thermomonospora echinospora]|uniref:Uncharacterized protein n=1 Tax=Thermomonospora echinospora TaxID=1992 RepID=A0A1H5T795_9ACTN|nr:hypothetical protein [Thermomonospora echinospora]SEF58028.1 hypothetical protein SAMN04489712_101491 [Thermomonospora echinospora]